MHQSHPGVLGSIPNWKQTRGTRENRSPPCVKVPGSSRFPAPRSLVCGGQPSPHKPRHVVSHITCRPRSSSPHAHSFVLGTAVINNNFLKHTPFFQFFSPGWAPDPLMVGIRGVTLSSAEAEFVAASQADQETVYLRVLMQGFNFRHIGATEIWEDNPAWG